MGRLILLIKKSNGSTISYSRFQCLFICKKNKRPLQCREVFYILKILFLHFFSAGMFKLMDFFGDAMFNGLPFNLFK